MAKRLSARETELARILSNGLDLFDAVRGYRTAAKPQVLEGNRYSEAIESLREMAEEEGIPIAVIGGVATVYHGYERYTKDMDIAVSADDFDQVIRTCYKYGFELGTPLNPRGINTLWYNGLEIELLQEGMFSGDKTNPTALPSPQELGVTSGLGFVDLELWARLKLSANRIKDDADIVEVLKGKGPEEIKKISDYMDKFNPNYARKFQELLHRAMDEKRRESALFRGN
jgi:hypothetical protein